MEEQHDSETIQRVFTEHRIRARVVSGDISPRMVRYHLHLTGAEKISKVESVVNELALALNVRNVRLVRDRGTLSLEVCRINPVPVDLSMILKEVNKNRKYSQGIYGILGITADRGMPLLLRLDSPSTTHVLISGTTGSGKTELLKTLIASMMVLAPSARFMFIDPKASDFALFEGLPGLKFPNAKDASTAIARLDWLVSEMEMRTKHQMKSPYLILVVDELADLIQVGGEDVVEKMTRLLQRGRSAGISIVAATQKPLSSLIGTLVKSNFPVRLVGRVLSSVDAMVAAGINGTGAEYLEGRGDFLLVAMGLQKRFQVSLLHEKQYESFRKHILKST